MMIRDARPDEFEDLARLQIRSWRSVYRGIMPDWYLDDAIEEDQLTRWANLKPDANDLILVADDGGIKGFVTVWCQPDPYVDNLHVDPDQRSKGTGRRLMRSVASRLIENAYDDVYLYVAAQNQRAAAFYRELDGTFGDIETLEQGKVGKVDAIKVTWTDLQKLSRAG